MLIRFLNLDVDVSSTVKIVVPTLVVASLLILAVVGYVLYRRRRKKKMDSLRETYQELDSETLFICLFSNVKIFNVNLFVLYAAAEVDALSSLKFEFRVIQAATSDFSDENKLGEGGFGPVYKVNFDLLRLQS